MPKHMLVFKPQLPHKHRENSGSEKTNCIGTESQIAIPTLTEASASGEIKDRAGCGSKNSPQKDELLRPLSTADGLTPMSLSSDRNLSPDP